MLDSMNLFDTGSEGHSGRGGSLDCNLAGFSAQFAKAGSPPVNRHEVHMICLLIDLHEPHAITQTCRTLAQAGASALLYRHLDKTPGVQGKAMTQT